MDRTGTRRVAVLAAVAGMIFIGATAQASGAAGGDAKRAQTPRPLTSRRTSAGRANGSSGISASQCPSVGGGTTATAGWSRAAPTIRSGSPT